MTEALVVDVQESLRRRPICRLTANPEVAARAALLAEHTRARGGLVCWVLPSEPRGAASAR